MRDIFLKHLQHSSDTYDEPKILKNMTLNIGDVCVKSISDLSFEFNLDKYKVQPTLLKNYRSHEKNLDFAKDDDNMDETLCEILAYSAFQNEMATIIWNYFDLYYPYRTYQNADEIVEVYCLHVLNHILKTRHLVVKNNSKIEKLRLSSKCDFNQDSRFQDRGFTRPKVLIMVPFRNSAFKIIQTMITLMTGTISEKQLVTNKHRFYQEFGGFDEPEMKYPSEERKELFEGNIDDCFRIGLALSRKTLRLYTDFYSSDIILCSPLGLKTLGSRAKKILTDTGTLEQINNGVVDEADVSEEKELSDETLDFLSSIEIFIMDQADVLLMQNWSHVLYIIKMLNKRPIKSHDVDFSRIREWYLNGHSGFYRQNLIFSKIDAPQIKSFFSNFCHNHEGSCIVQNTFSQGILDRIKSTLTHEFLAVIPSPKTVSDLTEARFKYFVSHVLPKRILEDNRKSLRRTLLYVPSYFDFIRIRNYLTDREIQFLSVTEYDDEKHIKKVRRLIKTFETGRANNFEPEDEELRNLSDSSKKRRTKYERENYVNSLALDESLLLLNTERSYFFRKPRFPAIHECLFYELPTYPDYYFDIYEDCSTSLTPTTITTTGHRKKQLLSSKPSIFDRITSIYDPKYDWIKLCAILGNDRAKILVTQDLSAPFSREITKTNFFKKDEDITYASNSSNSRHHHIFITGL